MQDEVDQKSIAFVINNGKFTGRVLERLALHYLRKANKFEEDVKRELKNPSPKQQNPMGWQESSHSEPTDHLLYHPIRYTYLPTSNLHLP